MNTDLLPGTLTTICLEVSPDNFLRLMLGYQLWHVLKWSNKVAHWMLKTDPLYPEGYGGRKGIKQRNKTNIRMELRRAALPRALKVLLPGYTPHNFELNNKEKVIAAGKLYAEMAAARQT